MPSVVVTPTAAADLDQIVVSNDLPEDTRDRIRALLEPLADFPEMGTELEGRWKGFRYLVGPWPWMLLIYVFDEDMDLVAVTAIQDARRGGAATSFG